MPIFAAALTAEQVAALTAPGYYSVGGVKGLVLHIAKDGKKHWTLQARLGTDSIKQSLGEYPEVSLSNVRSKGERARIRMVKTLKGRAAEHEARQAAKALEKQEQGSAVEATPEPMAVVDAGQAVAPATADLPPLAPLNLSIELDGRPIGIMSVTVTIPEAVQQAERINEQHVLHTLSTTDFKTWYATGELQLRYQRPAAEVAQA